METIDIDSEFEIIEALEGEVDSVSFYDVEKSLKNLLQKWSDVSVIVRITDKWKGVKIILQPGTSTQNKEMPIETFFHKITMVRNRIRVKEQKIYASNLDKAEKIDL